MIAACRLSRWTETYLDGELSPEHTVDFEDHLSECCACQSKLKFEQALRFSVRRTVRIETYPSPEFESRLRAMVAAARDDDAVSASGESANRGHQARPTSRTAQHANSVHPRPLTWRAIAPLSVAAAAALVFAAMRNDSNLQDQTGSTVNEADISRMNVPSKSDTMQTVRDFLDQLAADTENRPEVPSTLVEDVESPSPFLSQRPPSVINVSHGRRWPLPQLESLGGVLEGLHYRTVAIQGRVPSLHYRIGGHRVLLWAYDSERVPLRVILEPHVARNQPVFIGTHHGLTVAAVEHRGNGFVATTDLSPSEAAEFVVTASLH